MEADEGRPRGRFWRRAALVALALSLVLNVFLIGAFAGRRFGPDGEMGAMRMIGSALRGAPAETRALARRIRDERRPAMRAARAEIGAAQARLAQALAAEPFDAEALARAQVALREARARAGAVADEGLAALAAALDPPTRARLAERIAERAKRMAQMPDAPPE